MPEYTSDWVSTRLPLWLPHVAPLIGQPIQVLEIGTYEGRSAIWIAENIATHPDSRITTVDDWSLGGEKAHQRAMRNIREAGLRVKINPCYRHRDNWLGAEGVRYDLIYIDGDHRARAVLADSVIVWPFLRDGGFLIWDDYGYNGAECRSPERPPSVAIDAFLECYQKELVILHQAYQVIAVKKPHVLIV